MLELLPTQIGVVYDPIDEISVDICINANNDPRLLVTVLHERLANCDMHEFPGNRGKDRITVQDGEGLTIIVRRDGHIIGAGVFECDVLLVETIGAVLIPRSTSNLIVDQCAAAMLNRATTTALDRVACATAPLPVGEVQR